MQDEWTKFIVVSDIFKRSDFLKEFLTFFLWGDKEIKVNFDLLLASLLINVQRNAFVQEVFKDLLANMINLSFLENITFPDITFSQKHFRCFIVSITNRIVKRSEAQLVLLVDVNFWA